MSASARQSTIVLILAALALAVSACGGEDDGDGNATAGSGATGASGATGSGGAPEGSGAVPLDGPPDPELTVAEVAEELPLPEHVSDDEDFTETLDIFVAMNHKFWSESLVLSGADYHLPDEIIAYDGAAGDEGPDCGGAPAGVENAAYCRDPRNSKFGLIAWDETGLLEPLHNDLGDGSTAFIIGHEFAHMVQDRLGLIQRYPLTVEKELAADCLTGAVFQTYTAVGVEFGPAEVKSIQDGITTVGDQPGTPWQAEHAHGLAEERQAAFDTGYSGDVDTCLKEFKPGFSQ